MNWLAQQHHPRRTSKTELAWKQQDLMSHRILSPVRIKQEAEKPAVSFFPFFISIENTTEIVLVGLILSWTILLFGGFAFGWSRRPQSLSAAPCIPRELRLGSSLCLAIAAWVWLHNVRGFQSPEPAEAFALWFALGASLSCLGDFISLLINAAHAQLASLLAFMTAHAAYISGMAGLGREQRLWDHYTGGI
jgi:hypothetical protein